VIGEDGEAARRSVVVALFGVDLDDLLGQRVIPRLEFDRAFQEVDSAIGVGGAQERRVR